MIKQSTPSSLTTNLDSSPSEANTSSDLLSAALCEAGLDEFFISTNSDESDQQPSTSSSSSSLPAIPAAIERCQELRTTRTPLPGITASASTSPDLPINAASQSVAVNMGGVVASAPPLIKSTPGIASNAKMIRIIRADGTPVFVPIKSTGGTTNSMVQPSIRILVGSKQPAPSPSLKITDNTATTSTSKQPINVDQQQSMGIRPFIGRNQNTNVAAPSPTVPVHNRPLPPPFMNRVQQQTPTPSLMNNIPTSNQQRPALGRSRLLPAMVSPSSMQQQKILPALPSPMNALQKRNRLVHFNPNVRINEKTSSNIGGTTIPSRPFGNNPPPYPVLLDSKTTKPGIDFIPFDASMAMVGPMRPLTSSIPKPNMIGSGKNPNSSSISTNKNQIPDDVGMVEDEDDEELGFAETYADYIPAKLRSGLSHPDQVVETSSLSSVLPPDVCYHISIPEEVIDTGKLSALQLEAVIYACQKTETFLPSGERCGYLIGDGPGVGKGRTIAGFIYENYLLGRKRALWFSVSSDLKFDSERDLRDIGANRIKVYSLNKFKYSKISGKENGSVKKGVIFATYSSLIGESSSAKSKYRSRLKQLLQWCGKDYEGVVVFDECHRAKNLVPTGTTKPTKTGQTVLEIQKALPKARVLYASATGATETRNMAYMTRLGLWGPGKPFKDFGEFINAVEKRGVGAMEIVAMDMKLRGLYLARQLSFSGVTFRVEEVPLSEDFIRMYDESVKLWLEARKQFRLASELVDSERTQRKAMWSQFWAAHQRFFKYLCIAAKVQECVRMTRENVKNGKCVVIGLQSTGEARTLDQLEESGGELTDFVSTAKGVFQALIERHFPSADDNALRERSSSSRKEIKEKLFYLDDEEDDFFSEMSMKPNRGAWKRKLVAEHREKKKIAKLGKDEEDEWPESSASGSSDEDDEKNDEDGSDNNDGSDSESESSTLASDDEDEDNEGSGSGSDTGEEVEDKFNPFADDMDEADPWESKILDKSVKRKKRRKKASDEHDEELERQLEQALNEASGDEEEKEKIEKKTERLLPAVSAIDFLASSSSYMDTVFKPGRFANELGLNKVQIVKAELLAAVERLGEILPPNTLDQLINELGGPEHVAEMTGRKGRVVSRDDGEIFYELRNDDCDVPLELLNVAERERFMNGEKHIAIISEAASSGISLQSDRRAKNQRRRVHITLELPWSADKAVQQFGRTHRSNQVSAPEYVFLISELAGEQRFASIVAKRLESLGALTHGDRRATESRDLSQFNLDTKYGRAALEVTLKSIVGQLPQIVPPPIEYKGEFFHDMRQYLEGVGVVGRDDPNSGIFSIEKDTNLAKFLNRLLGLPVMAQNCLFQYFSDSLREVVDQAKRDCKYDLGILDLGSGGEMVRKMETHIFYGKFETGSLKTELHTVMVERGISWEGALEICRNHTKPNDGFYVLNNPSITPTVILVCDAGKKRSDNGEKLHHIFRPNVGLSSKMETFSELKKRFKKVTLEKAETIWNEHFEASSHMCQHEYWFGRCRTNEGGWGSSGGCDVGRRKRAYHILSGSVLTVWNTVENVLSSLPGRRQSRMQVVRLRTEKGQKIVGILVPPSCKKTLIEKLAEESSRTSTEKFD